MGALSLLASLNSFNLSQNQIAGSIPEALQLLKLSSKGSIVSISRVFSSHYHIKTTNILLDEDYEVNFLTVGL